MKPRRWRFYATSSGRSAVRDFLDGLTEAQATQVLAAMRTVAELGLVEARHLRGDIYEVRASIGGQAFRVLFANEGKRGQILLALEAFEKKSQRTPPRTIALAETRLADLRGRARPRSTP